MKIELLFRIVCTDLKRLNYSKRQYSLTFKMPNNGRLYIALTFAKFKSHISDWFGPANDCYILQ